jgi:hypothetical protein
MAKKLQLTVLFPRDCTNCESPAGSSECDYRCPSCRGKFCSHCYKTDPRGDGTFVFCPNCKIKLYFPETPQSAPEFQVGDVCVFTNRGSSGVTANNGKQCKILRVKEFWVNPKVPEYNIQFLHNGNGFGVSERELELVVNRKAKSRH